MDSIEGNKIIVEFVGLVGYNQKGHPAEYGYYDKQWGYLMEVVEKIEAIHAIFDHDYINVRISQGYVEIQGGKN